MNVTFQNSWCQARVSAATGMWVKPLVGLIFCLVKKCVALQSTDKRIPKRFQQGGSSCCTGEKKAPPLFTPTRSEDEWLVGDAKRDALLKAPVGVDPNQPPSSGWQFQNDGKYEEDPNLSCTNLLKSPCGILTVSLSGQAEKECSSCAGMYESTGLISMGRQVI